MDNVLLMVAMLGIPAIVILVPLGLRSWERRRILDAVMAASNAGQPVPAQLIEALIAGSRGKEQHPREARDRRRGILLIGTALVFMTTGFALFALLTAVHVHEGVPAGIALAGLGFVPGVIGGTYLWLSKHAPAG